MSAFIPFSSIISSSFISSPNSSSLSPKSSVDIKATPIFTITTTLSLRQQQPQQYVQQIPSMIFKHNTSLPVSFLSRRSFLLSLLFSVFLPIVNPANALLMDAVEASQVLRLVSDKVNGSEHEWENLAMDELRLALRSGYASRLRVAVNAVPKLCASSLQSTAQQARDEAIRALEKTDLTALKVSRKQANIDDVAVHLKELGVAVDQLLKVLETVKS